MSEYFSYTNPCNADITYILNGVYISDWHTTTNIELLNSLGIKTIINVTGNKKNSKLLEKYTENGIKDYQFYFEDEEEEQIIQCFDTVYGIVEKARSQKKEYINSLYGRNQ